MKLKRLSTDKKSLLLLLQMAGLFLFLLLPSCEKYTYDRIDFSDGSVVMDSVYYEGGFSFELRGHFSGIEDGLSVLQHGFCWSTTNPNPQFDSDTVQLGKAIDNVEFSYLVTVAPTTETTPYYIRTYAIIENTLGEEEVVFGEVYTFDGDFNYWTPIADYPGDPRIEALSFVLNDKGYVGMGWKGSGAYGDFWIYNPALGWDPTPMIFDGTNNAGSGLAVVGGIGFAIKGKGYIGFGNGLGTTPYKLWEFDPTADTMNWTGASSFNLQSEGVDDVPWNGVGFSINDSLGYIGTGSKFNSNNNVKWMLEFDLALQPVFETKIKRVSDFLGLARTHATGFSIGDKGYIGLGGASDMFEYDPQTDEWTEKTSFPGVIRERAVGFELNGKGYVCAGRDLTTNEPLNDLWEFDPNDDSLGRDANGNPLGRWFRRADLPKGFIDGIGFSAGQKGYAGLGSFSKFGEMPLVLEPLMWEFNP